MKRSICKPSLRTKHFSLLFALTIAAVLVVAMPLPAFAHPLGNFTINRYSRIEATATGLHLFHIIDMAEIPAHQERSALDGNHDGEISEQEKYRPIGSSMPAINA